MRNRYGQIIYSIIKETLMDNIISRIAFQKSKAMMLAIMIAFSLFASLYSNIENYKAIASASISTANQASNAITTSSTNRTIPIANSSGSDSNTKEFTLIAEEATLNISPGDRIKAWTYNGSIPGPTIRVSEGDKVIVHFINKLDMPHTIHFHGGHNGTVDGVFEIIPPNGTFTYEFIATPAGALMYHCHVMPVVQHVRMGLYGAFIVDPIIPLPPAKEFLLIFGDYDSKDIMTSDPESMFFNGYKNIHYDYPLPVYENETARVYLINLAQLPAFGYHVHGTLFKTWISGILLNSPIHTQTWATSSGDAAIFELKWPWTGKFLFHMHGFAEERGSMGYFNVTSPTSDLIDGKDIAITKPVSMIGWQENLTRTLQNATTDDDHEN
jgi:nitrite reductase (NO-forming)